MKFILSPIVITAALNVVCEAQSVRKARSRAPSTVPTSISSLEGTREEDGLIGPVRRVRTETAKLSMKSGKLMEGRRALTETTVYDLEGKRIENTYYPVAESHNPLGQEEYKYDDRGNVTMMTLRDQKGAILSREVYAYEFDKVGNWKKMITSLTVYENGLKYEPVEVTYRTISYYSNKSMANVDSSDSPAITPLVVPPAENVRRAAGSKMGSLVKVDGNLPDPAMPTALRVTTFSDSGVVIPKASYPDEAKRAGVSGTVAVKVTLDPQGNVIEARAISGPAMLRASAEEAALKARLLPGSKTQLKRSSTISFTFALLP